MNGEAANKFISALVKALQTLCHGYVDFNDGIEIIGHIYLNIDSGSSFDYVVKEKLCKNAENSTVFVSKSFQAQPPPDDYLSKKDRGDNQAASFEDSSMSPTSGTSRIQSAITSISNVLSGTQESQKSRLLEHPSHHSSPQNTGKRKREHNGNYSSVQPPFKYTTLQISSSPSTSTYFSSGPLLKQATDRNHSEHFSRTSHTEFFGGDSNQSSGMGPDNEDDLHLDVTFVKEEYESQRNSSQRGVSSSAASRLSQDLSSNQSNILHDGASGSGTLDYSSSHHQLPQQFASGTAGDMASLNQGFQDSSHVDVEQHTGQRPPNPRTSLALADPTSANCVVSPPSTKGSAFDLPTPAPQQTQILQGQRGSELVHTLRQTKWAVARAREWLAHTGTSTQFEQFTNEQIDQMLLGFYTSGQKKDGAPFSAQALLAFRTAINRYLNKCGRQISIATSHSFKKSNALLNRLVAIPAKVSKKAISVQDIKLMYTSGTLSNSHPEALLCKVWFELLMQFRGKIDWSKVYAEHFFFTHSLSGRLSVTWNTRGLGGSSEMVMFEATGDSYCPVESLRIYMEHRNSACKVLLEVPASSDMLAKGVWYLPEEVRDYKERCFMKRISSHAKLSHTYTNTCILNSFDEYRQAMFSLRFGQI